MSILGRLHPTSTVKALFHCGLLLIFISMFYAQLLKTLMLKIKVRNSTFLDMLVVNSLPQLCDTHWLICWKIEDKLFVRF